MIQTELGAVVVEVDLEHAPLTAANFLGYVDKRFYDGGVINRSVRPDNTTRPSPCPENRRSFRSSRRAFKKQTNQTYHW